MNLPWCRCAPSLHTHTLLITCTCCYDQIKGTQDKDFSYSFSDSLSTHTVEMHSYCMICQSSAPGVIDAVMNRFSAELSKFMGTYDKRQVESSTGRYRQFVIAGDWTGMRATLMVCTRSSRAISGLLTRCGRQRRYPYCDPKHLAWIDELEQQTQVANSDCGTPSALHFNPYFT